MTVRFDTRKSCESKLLLIGSEIFCLGSIGNVGKVEETKDRNRQGDDAICGPPSAADPPDLKADYYIDLTYEENPLPALEVCHARHAFMNGSHHDARKHCAHLTRCCEERSALRNLVRFIPRPNDVYCPWVGAALGYS